MAQGIRLSPKYGLNPTIPVCFWCGKERNEVALMGYMSKKHQSPTAWGGVSTTFERDIEAPRYSVIDYEPCEECKKNMSLGFTVIEATQQPNRVSSVPIQKGVYPTGRYVVLKTEAAHRIFGGLAPDVSKAFLSSEDFSRMFT